MLRAAALALVAVLCAGPALAQSCREILAGLEPNEIVSDLRGPGAVEITPAEMEAVIGPLATYGDPSAVPPLRSGTLRRTIPVLWRAKLPRRADIERMRVIYRVRPGRGADGVARRVGSGAGGVDALPIAVQAERPVEVCRHRGWKLVEGGALVEMDIGALPAAGRYRARIRVRLRDW
ncbi:MAG: hypothetical protein AAGI51_13125 [Pseudomonadota bacterium]